MPLRQQQQQQQQQTNKQNKTKHSEPFREASRNPTTPCQLKNKSSQELFCIVSSWLEN